MRKGLVTGDLFVRIHAALSVREDVRCEVKVVLKALGRCIEDTEVSSGYYEQYRQFTFYLKGKEPFVLVELVLPYETPLTEDIVLLSLCRMALERIYEFVKQVVRQEEEKWTVCSIALGLRFCGLHGCLFSRLLFLRGFLLHRHFLDGMRIPFSCSLGCSEGVSFVSSAGFSSACFSSVFSTGASSLAISGSVTASCTSTVS